MIEHEIRQARYSPATLACYRSAWRAYSDWGADEGIPLGPARFDGELISRYIAHRLAAGASMATANMIAASIRHQSGETDTPIRHAAALAHALRGAARLYGRPQRQARPITDSALAAIRRLPDGAPDEESRCRAVRDVALIAVMTDAGLRVSEAAAVTWSDIAQRDVGGILLVRRGKTDPRGAGRPVYVGASAMSDLDAYRHTLVRPRPESRAWPLSPDRLGAIVRQSAFAAGLGEGYSGHSPRVGLAVRMHAAGASLTDIMRQGRWTSAATVARYLRGIEAEQASQWLP